MLLTMGCHRVCAALAALWIAGFAAPPAKAQQQPPPEPAATSAPETPPTAPSPPKKADIEAAKAHYVTATQALATGEFIVAAREFFAAYELTRDPLLFFKVGLAHDMAGDCGSAAIFYRRYLEEAQPTGAEKEDAEQRLAACDAKLEPVAPPAPAASDRANVVAKPTAPVPPAEPAPVDDVEPEDSDAYNPAVGSASPLEVAGYVTLGAAAAAATAAAVLSLSANARQEEIEDLLAPSRDGVRERFEGSTREQYENAVSEGEDLELAAYIAWGVAGAAATTALVLLLVADDPPPEGIASVVPVAGPQGSVGVTASWTF